MDFIYIVQTEKEGWKASGAHNVPKPTFTAYENPANGPKPNEADRASSIKKPKRMTKKKPISARKTTLKRFHKSDGIIDSSKVQLPPKACPLDDFDSTLPQSKPTVINFSLYQNNYLD